MEVQAKEHLEREELQSVLSSGILAKSPNLEKLLSYICEKYWEGKSDQLKEYNLGVEALGRPPDFEPATNAIVRVEVHRLREKLKKYYQDGGANHQFLIFLQPGRYVPQFICRGGAAPREFPGETRADHPEAEKHSELIPLARLGLEPGGLAPSRGAGVYPAPKERAKWSLPSARFLTIAGVLMAAAVGTVLLYRLYQIHSAQRLAPTMVATNAEQAPPELGGSGQHGVRIIAGYSRKSYVDRSGNVWQGDAYFDGGGIDQNVDRFIARTPDPTLFETDRRGEFSYNIPAKPGAYELWLYFVETLYGPGTLFGGGETSRLFTVQVNGRTVLNLFDIYADTGGNFIADARVFKDISPAADGDVHIRFIRRIGDPAVCAIKLTPTVDGKLQPIHIVAQDDSYTDGNGQEWTPDTYFKGGRLILRRTAVSGTTEPGLFEGERYGNFDYAIPVAQGEYGVTLYFAERYFGPGMPGQGGVGSRVFDVICNENALLRDFDVFKDAGGANRALVKTFHGLVPNAQGKLMIRFLPVVNYALLDAISVVDESKRQ
jgi:hypothetical protein